MRRITEGLLAAGLATSLTASGCARGSGENADVDVCSPTRATEVVVEIGDGGYEEFGAQVRAAGRLAIERGADINTYRISNGVMGNWNEPGDIETSDVICTVDGEPRVSRAGKLLIETIELGDQEFNASPAEGVYFTDQR